MQHVDHPCALCHSFYGRTAYASIGERYHVTCWGWFVFTPILSDSPTSPNSDFKITKNELVDFYHQQFVKLKLGVATIYQMESKDDELLIIRNSCFQLRFSFSEIQVLAIPEMIAAKILGSGPLLTSGSWRQKTRKEGQNELWNGHDWSSKNHIDSGRFSR